MKKLDDSFVREIKQQMVDDLLSENSRDKGELRLIINVRLAYAVNPAVIKEFESYLQKYPKEMRDRLIAAVKQEKK